MLTIAYIMRPYRRQVRLAHLLSLHSHNTQHTITKHQHYHTTSHTHTHCLHTHTTDTTLPTTHSHHQDALSSTQRHRATPICSSIRGIHWRWPRRSRQLPEVQGRRAHHRCICHWTSFAHLSVTPKQHQENRGRWPWWSWQHGHRD